MSELRPDTLTLPAAELGPHSPLPMLTPIKDVHAHPDSGAADEEMERNLSYGRLGSLLPYTVQDGYGRARVPCALPTVVLENEHLRAIFLPGWGGRLWSLVDRSSGRELLYRNPVLQPANFALRGAWFSGGVEWNIGATGHSPLTCTPLHAARVQLDDGTPVLRLYEWERNRGLVFQVDTWLPDSSPVLLVRVRVVNPGQSETPMYWWSNIAVPEHDGVRVLAPAESAYHFSYDKRLQIAPIPEHDARDVTYPAERPRPGDYFFDCGASSRPWIAAVDADGRGLVHASTSELRGRKLFVWGRAPGGRHWQDFLSGGHSDQEYCEIQAGLARTQLEHLPMPPGAQWSWVEAYGPIDLPADKAHGAWATALGAVEDALDRLLPDDQLARVSAQAATWADRVPAETLAPGSGWGALERRRRQAGGEAPMGLAGLPFPEESLGPEQQPWLELVEHGALSEPAPEAAPVSYIAGDPWRRLLESAPDQWATYLHRGLTHWAAGDADTARACWEESVTLRENPWALRNLAVVDRLDGAHHRSAERYRRAHELVPASLPLTIETLQALLEAGRATQALDIIDSLEPSDRTHGRIQLLEARAALDTSDLGRAGAILDAGIVVADLREGSDTLGALWQDYCEVRRKAGRPLTDETLPYAYDFRMHNETETP